MRENHHHLLGFGINIIWNGPTQMPEIVADHSSSELSYGTNILLPFEVWIEFYTQESFEAMISFERMTTRQDWLRFSVCSVTSLFPYILNDTSQSSDWAVWDRSKERSAARHMSSRYFQVHLYTVVKVLKFIQRYLPTMLKSVDSVERDLQKRSFQLSIIFLMPRWK